MKSVVTETALEIKFWSAAIRTAAYFLENGFTVLQPRPILKPFCCVFVPFTLEIVSGRTSSESKNWFSGL